MLKIPRLKFKSLLVYIFAYCLANCPSFVQAQDPPPANGDGVCNNLLLDQALAQGRKSFKPQDLSIFQSDIAPILKLADQLPDFGKALRVALSKQWSFDAGNSFSDCQTEDAHFMAVSGGVKVACQYPSSGAHANEIIIDPNWYETLDPKTCQQPKTSADVLTLKEKQKALFVHELLLGITMNSSNTITEAATNQVFAALTRQTLPSASELQGIIERSGFGIYGLKNDPNLCNPLQTSAPSPDAALTPAMAAVRNLAASCAADEDALLTAIDTLTYGCGITSSYGVSSFQADCMRTNINKALTLSTSTLGASSDVSQALTVMLPDMSNVFNELSALPVSLGKSTDYSVDSVQKRIVEMQKMMKNHQAVGDCF